MKPFLLGITSIAVLILAGCFPTCDEVVSTASCSDNSSDNTSCIKTQPHDQECGITNDNKRLNTRLANLVASLPVDDIPVNKD